MPRNTKPGSARINLDIPLQAKIRFLALHELLGYKTQTETFAAMVYAVSTKDKIDPHIVERIERKIDHITEHLEDFA